VRRRLLASTVGIALVCVAVLGIPLALLARHQVWTSARDRIREQAASIATGLEDRLDAGQPVDLSRFVALMPHRRIIVTPAHGRRAVAGTPLHGHLLRATASVSDSTVTVEADHGPTVTRARAVTVVVAALGLLATLAAVALALWQARRIAAPIGDLAARADELGRGTFATTAAASGIPEIDHVAEALERSAHQVGTLVELQREFASDAAHQLRTPLTSIGLHLEEIGRIGQGDIRAEADDSLAQVERLNSVIGSLLQRARGDATDPTILDLGELATDASAPWARVLERRSRRLVLDIAAGVQVLARRAHLLSVMASLLDNALTHGDGDVRLTVRQEAGLAQLRVSDEGAGVPDELADRIFTRQVSGNKGTGIGLALAHSLAAAESGSLVLSRAIPAEFTLTLPALR
jgi:signal transduction histidine kinase